MLKIILSGCQGHMGQVITKLVEEQENTVIIAGVDVKSDSNAPYPVYKTFSEIQEAADVIIDFSHPSVLEGLLEYCHTKHIPAVIATTGLSCCQVDTIREVSQKVALFYSGNMSLGINLLAALVKKAAQILGDRADIEIIEAHHNQKIDAPSGTANMLLDAAIEGLDKEMVPVYDRHSRRQKRDANEIGMHSIRGGTIVGEHQVIFAGKDEVVTLSHSAHSKEVFAVGAVKAAVFLADKSPGLYDMTDIVAES
ncbi:MAG: 4-hydroxy-tetrahydrodipicolinate reductase [Clostridia bacterium]|nr:4-hydroxy-tetrahydrodipicolinate reductase [Clostridia bacterium]